MKAQFNNLGRIMEEKSNNTFEVKPVSSWKDLPQYEGIDYVQEASQETVEGIPVLNKDLQNNREPQIPQQADKFYYRYNLLQQIINPEQTKQLAQRLHEKANLLRLIATPLAFHLLQLYGHLLKVDIKTKGMLKVDAMPFTLISDEEGNLIEAKFNLNEVAMEQVITFLEKSFAFGFDWVRILEVCAKEILTYLSVSALEKMEKCLGIKTV